MIYKYTDEEKRGMKIVLKQLIEDLPEKESLFILEKASRVFDHKKKIFYLGNDEIRITRGHED